MKQTYLQIVFGHPEARILSVSLRCGFSGCAMNFRCFSLVCPDYI
jgi:hypothetical protein